APLAENLLAAALTFLPAAGKTSEVLKTSEVSPDDMERLYVTLAAVEYLLATSQDARADALVAPLLDHPTFAKGPMLWRLAARIAERRDQKARSIECLEKALDIEFQTLPDVVNVQQVRQDYGKLLGHYEWLAGAAIAMKRDVPADVTAKTIRAADRWRA